MSIILIIYFFRKKIITDNNKKLQTKEDKNMAFPKPRGPSTVGCTTVMTKAKSIPVDFQPSWLCAQYTDLGLFFNLYYPSSLQEEDEKKKFERVSWMPSEHTNWYCNGLSVNNLKTSWFSFVVNYCQSEMFFLFHTRFFL